MAKVTVFQAKGRGHIRYINRLAHNIWEKYGYKDEMWVHSLGEAFKSHIDMLNSANEMNELEKKKKKQPGSGSWYRDKNNQWVELER